MLLARTSPRSLSAAWLAGSLALALAGCGGASDDDPALASETLVGEENDWTCHAAEPPAGCVVESHGGHDYLRCDGTPVPSISRGTAEARCAAWGGTLVTIEDDAENAFLATFVASGSATDYYVGARLVGTAWRWPDQRPFYDQTGGVAIDGAYEAWGPDQPPSDAGTGGSVVLRAGEWIYVTGSARRGYVCETAAPACEATEACGNSFDDDGDGHADCVDDECASESWCTVSAGESQCADARDDDGDGAPDCEDASCRGTASCPTTCPGATPTGCVEVRSGDTLFYACAAATWLEARDLCAANGFALATIDDAAQRSAVGRAVRDLAAAQPLYNGLGAWVGANDRADEGLVLAVDGTAMPEASVWASGEPRATSPDLDCAISGTSGAHAMRRCSLRLPYVCEPRALLCDPPTITAQPASATVLEGTNATFSVTARGRDLTYQWQRDGVDLEGATSASLVLPAITTADEGARLRVVITNPYGTITSDEAVLTVRLRAPTIATQPANTAVYEGTGASFTVVANGSALSYQWERDGSPIDGATSPTLTLATVALEDDNATFRCAVSNVSGTVRTRAARLDVLSLPRISADPVDTTVLEGARATFRVTATGAGPMTYQWLRDGAAIPGAVATTYTIAATTMADHGAVFSAIASNAGGSATSAGATLSITRRAPRLVTGLANTAVAEGSPVAFEVVVAGTGLSYVWERDGVLIDGATTARYELAAVTLADDRAVFRVTATNEAGSVHSQATLRVTTTAPVITREPSDVTVAEDEAATFRVVATGTALAYQWQRDGVDIPGARGGTYRITHVTAADHGAHFRCVVSNPSGAVTSRDALLTVLFAAPVITTGPADVSVDEGDDATFSVTATGAALSYAWRRNGVVIPGETERTLVLRDVSMADDGAQIVAVVSNTGGSVESDPATLTVRAGAPRILAGPDDVIVDEGALATFSVTADGAAPLSYQWRRNAVDIAGATSSSYSTPPVTLADESARFSVVVCNAGGCVTSREASIDVRATPPVIVTAPAELTVTEGESASFHVVASGSELTYRWLRNGELVPAATTDTLTLTARADDDGAAYSVVVENAAGSVTSAAALLHVTLLPPVIVTAPADLTIDEGDAIHLVAEVSGSRLTIEWERNGVLLAGADSATLHLDGATLADDGARFRIIARNSAGSATAEARVTVRMRAPRIATQPASLTVDEGAPASFSVVAEGSALGYQWQRDGADLPGATLASLTLPAVSYADRNARFRVRVTNAAGSVTSDEAVLSVRQLPPSITTQPVGQSVAEGETATFTVEASGSELTYQWLVNGVERAGATSSTFALGPVTTADDATQVQVRVANAAGSALSAIATLEVTGLAPAITEEPADQSVLEGDTATFQVTALRALAYQWRRDGVAIPGAGMRTLSLAAALADDDSVYDCVVSNAVGSVVSRGARLRVAMRAPAITTEPADVAVTEGEGASFTVVASGSALSYAWRRDGVAIPGANTATYAIAVTTLADDGAQFDCVVTNAAGSAATRLAALDVALAAPVIVAAPENVRVMEGGTATFRVTATGSLLSYQWLRDGVELMGATSDTYSLSPVALTDDGAGFSVRVQNAAGSITTPVARVIVDAAPPRIVAQPESLTVDEGASATFSVSAEGAALAYQWQRDGVDIAGATSASYTLLGASLADTGAQLTVVVSNTAGTVTSAPATLTVRLLPPRITTAPASLAVDEGAAATFTCGAEGSLLTYRWQRGDVDIADALSATYTLAAAALADDGATFRCVVTNAAGSVTSAAATLTVRARPRITSSPASLSVIEGASASFSVVATGAGPLTYQWLRDGVAIPGAVLSTYTIPAAAFADSGAAFRVIVSNAIDSATSDTATLTVVRPAPVITSGLSDTSVREGGTATFEVIATGAGLTYRWERDGAPIAGATGPAYAIGSVSTADDGALFAVFVSNAGGTVSSSATLHVTLDAPVITAEPADASVLENESATFTVAADGTALSYRWERDGTPIAGATSPSYTLATARITDDGARFRCVVTNAGGSVTSRAALLTVAPRPPVIATAPASTTVTEGDDATFTVTATGSLLSYAWRVRGVLVSGATTPTLTLDDVTLAQDGADVVAVVTNPAGTVESAPAILTVAVRAPRITSSPADLTVDEGASASFSVSAEGSLLGYQWRRNGAPIFGATSPTYTLAAVTLADSAARFDCVVANAGGNVISDAATLTVRQLAPRIVVAPSAASVDEGETASFSVVAEGSELTYQWLRGGAPIAGATSSSYALTASIDDDGALFSVRVTNGAGSVTSAEVLLSVALLPPTLVRAPADVTVVEGEPATFDADVTGSRVTIQWEREGVAIAGATTDSYTLAATTLADEGARFRIVATNAAGSVSAEAVLHVTRALPRITAQPEARTADEGSTATFSVVAVGSDLTYQWRINGADIPSATSASYTRDPVTIADRGARFSVVVTNPAGSVTSDDALLTVRQLPPVITASPATQSVLEGTSATFTVIATGSELTYAWLVDGAEVAGETSASFELGPVALADEGTEVRARVENGAGSVLSDVAVLHVTPAAPVITTQPADADVLEGAPASFALVAERADAYQWRRDGADIAGATSATLSIAATTLADHGARFDCVVTNEAGSVTSSVATLSVRIAPPRIGTEPADLRVTEGQPASFTVAGLGSLLRYQWRRGGAPIAGANAATYTIAATTLADDGASFDCVVENDGGNVTTRLATLDVDVAAPSILASPTDLTVDEGGTASFDVTASGSLLAYQWQRDGADIAGATTSTLSLATVTLADDGARFTAVVTNPGGTVTSAAATLHVRVVIPTITTHPADLTVDEGSAASFSVAASGSHLVYQWRRDSAAIPGAVAATYSLPATTLADSGAHFDCVVSNEAGSVTTTAATLTVRQLPPSIVEPPVAVTVDEGSDATFRVTASGTGLSYRWQRDDADIASATTDTLTLTAVALGDDGAMIRAIVTNGAGSVTTDAVRLTVRPLPPRITAQPASLTVTEGDPASFHATAVGAGLTYQWRRDAADIAGATSATYSLPSAALTDDAAVFTCVVTNVSGSVTTAPATLTVRVRAPSITRQPVSLSVEEASNATFDVEASGSRLTYQWQRDGADIAGATAASLALSTVSPDDDGASFRVVVANEGGSVTSSAALLTVRLAVPRITTQPASETVDEGSAAVFSVVAAGSRLGYQWQHDGVDLPGQNGTTLTLTSASLADRGEYRVRVTNTAGTVTSDPATLTLRLRPPGITTHPATQIVRVGEAATFSVVATGSELTYQWFKDGFPVSGATGATYAIATVARTDAGAYHVEVRNSGGVAPSTEAVLTVRSALPRITTQPTSATVATGASVTFSVVAEGESLAYQWTRFGTNISGATSASYTFTAADADDTAPYACVVSNDGGSVTSAPATLTIRDMRAPSLDVDGGDRTTTDTFVVLTGSATDDRGAPTVRATSDRFEAQTFAATPSEVGTFSLEVPLAVGDNVITVRAEDAALNASATRTVRVRRDLPTIPRITITEPLSGAVTTLADTTVRGTVLTSLDPTTIRLSLGALVAFPTGSAGTYSFVFDRVPLAFGTNTLTVVGETSLGSVSASTTVIRSSGGDGGTGPGTSDAPVIAMPGIREDSYYAGDRFELRGTVTAQRCVAQVTVNGATASLTAAGTNASFAYTVVFGALTDLPVSVSAVDCDGRTATATFTAHRDGDAPVIALDGLLDPPTDNPFLGSPAHISGTIRDASLAGVAIEGITLGLLPGGEAGLWTFTADVPLSRAEVRTIRVAAWDRAGHSSERTYRLRLDASVDLALVAPLSGERVFVSGASGDVRIEASASGLSPTDTVVGSIDGGVEIALSRSGGVYAGTISGVAAGASHVARVRVRSGTGDILAQASATFEVTDDESIPLALVSQAPANGASLIEPNAFLELRFNRPLDPERLTIQMRETVHGLEYSETPEGADITELSTVELVDVDREREPVSGNTVALPDEMTVIFYPGRDLAYGADVYLDISYDGEPVGHSTFSVRPLPTLVHGFVADHNGQPIPGIQLSFPEIGLTAVTDTEGAWDLGYGWPADRVVPAGLHRVLINPGMRNPEYGSTEAFVLAREGQDSSVGVLRVVFLDPTEPFRRVSSGAPAVLLARGDFTLDLSHAALVFPDGRGEGDMHAQMHPGADLTYERDWPVDFGYVSNPPGVQVTGDVAVSGAFPPFDGSYDYVDRMEDYILLFGLDPDSLSLQVVGVARIDHATRRFASEGPVQLRRLDVVAFAPVPDEAQPMLAGYASGSVSLATLRAAFTSRP